AGYCARRFISRERRSFEASGSARSEENLRALRADGVEAYLFDGARAEAGIEKAIERAEAIVVSIPPRDGGQRPSERFAPAIAA
ncbi:hypothetical protein, partial [Klebsiella pneumoniae]|uniref:hypothetical protein n=1 Tax=Klebsiella pneumoniae TaxID=573 RepID=UPI0030133F87